MMSVRIVFGARQVLDLVNNWETIACGRAHAGPVTSVAWTSDERQLVSAADDSTVAIWSFYGDHPPRHTVMDHVGCPVSP